ncbi:MAG: RagB/SusD family nutrient uptake outer membrane protein [Bacteroidota bacterium]
MKKIKSSLALILMIMVINSCQKDFLEVAPKGALDPSVLATPEGVDALLIGAYSMLDGISSQGTGGWEAASSNWVFGSIRGLEANKGTDSGDQPDINPIQTYSESATNPYLNLKWRAIYEGISRANAALTILKEAEKAGTIDAAKAESFRKQARTLRGYFHFEAWRMWAKADGSGIPYVAEDTDLKKVTNASDVRANIIADLQEGTSLPDDMDQIGRFNGTVAKVLLAKAHMQMNKDYAAAKTLLQDVKTNGKKPDGSAIGLEPLYGDIFDISKRNGVEAIYTVQYSVNDGSGGWNGGWGEVLNFPYKGGGSPGGCCGFFQPSQEFVNSFRTVGGLPLLDFSYNNVGEELLRDQGVPSGGVWDAAKAYKKDEAVTVYAPGLPYIDRAYRALTDNTNKNPLVSPTDWDLLWVEDNSLEVDPRLDWTVGRRGIPYLDWGVHTGQDWIRDQSYAGPYSPKKQVYKKSQEGTFTEVGNWTSGWTANGYRMIRYADVLLLLAECQVETNDLANALINVNLVRNRAANSAGFVKEDDNATDAASYDIAPYGAFADQATARKAVQMERKLELGMEGHRYFDLQRWGIAVTELNRILTYEKPKRSALYGTITAGAEDVNYPIPQRQIDLSNGLLVQNR